MQFKADTKREGPAGSAPGSHTASPDELNTLLARTVRLLERTVGPAAGGTKQSFLARRLAAEVECRGLVPLSELLGRAEQGEAGALLALRNLVSQLQNSAVQGFFVPRGGEKKSGVGIAGQGLVK